MTFPFSALLAAVLLVAACGSNEEPVAAEVVDPGVALNEMFEEYADRYLEMNPVQATFNGVNRYNDRMANSNSPEYRAAAEAMDQEFLRRLLEIDREQLNEQDRLSYDIFRIQREESLEGNQFPSHLQPINQFYSITNFFVQLGSGAGAHPFKTVKDYEDFLSRADDYSVIIDQVITNMKEGMRQGLTQPRILMEKLQPQIDAHIVDDPKDSNFYAPVANMPEDFSDEDRARLTAAYEEKIMNTIVPSYQRISNFLGDEYLRQWVSTRSRTVQPGTTTWCVCARRPIWMRFTRSASTRWRAYTVKCVASWKKSASRAT
jgi:uncharacterized protein (DUF885 family)